MLPKLQNKILSFLRDEAHIGNKIFYKLYSESYYLNNYEEIYILRLHRDNVIICYIDNIDIKAWLVFHISNIKLHLIGFGNKAIEDITLLPHYEYDYDYGYDPETSTLDEFLIKLTTKSGIAIGVKTSYELDINTDKYSFWLNFWRSILNGMYKDAFYDKNLYDDIIRIIYEYGDFYYNLIYI